MVLHTPAKGASEKACGFDPHRLRNVAVIPV